MNLMIYHHITQYLISQQTLVAQVKGLAYKHNMMPALKYCGSNNVAHFSWSPTGEYLFFDLSHTGNLLDASKEKKTLHSLPIPRPTGDPTWINTQKIAAPVPPLEDDVEARVGNARAVDLQWWV